MLIGALVLSLTACGAEAKAEASQHSQITANTSTSTASLILYNFNKDHKIIEIQGEHCNIVIYEEKYSSNCLQEKAAQEFWVEVDKAKPSNISKNYKTTLTEWQANSAFIYTQQNRKAELDKEIESKVKQVEALTNALFALDTRLRALDELP